MGDERAPSRLDSMTLRKRLVFRVCPDFTRRPYHGSDLAQRTAHRFRKHEARRGKTCRRRLLLTAMALGPGLVLADVVGSMFCPLRHHADFYCLLHRYAVRCAYGVVGSVAVA